MFAFLREIFNKPTYQWTFWEEAVFSLIVIMAFAILFLICSGLYAWHNSRMEEKKSRCKNCKFDNYWCREHKCFRCKNYKKPDKPKS